MHSLCQVITTLGFNMFIKDRNVGWTLVTRIANYQISKVSYASKRLEKVGLTILTRKLSPVDQ